MSLRSMTDIKEGWQAARGNSTRVYHYIRDSFALCQGLGFYVGDLVPDAGAPRDNEDCANCFRRLRNEQKRTEKKEPSREQR